MSLLTIECIVGVGLFFEVSIHWHKFSYQNVKRKQIISFYIAKKNFYNCELNKLNETFLSVFYWTENKLKQMQSKN